MATAPPETTEARRNARAARIALVAGAVLLVLVLVWLLFLRGDGEPEEAAAPAPPPAAQPATPVPALEPAAPDDDKGAPVSAFEVFGPRDPFEPLVDTTAAAGTGATSGDATGGTGGGGGGSGGSGGGAGDGGGGGGTSVDGHRVQVIDVYRRGGSTRVQVEVDGTVYTVETGDTFADSFELVSASGECATLLFGDDEFTLCEGEEILK